MAGAEAVGRGRRMCLPQAQLGWFVGPLDGWATRQQDMQGIPDGQVIMTEEVAMSTEQRDQWVERPDRAMGTAF